MTTLTFLALEVSRPLQGQSEQPRQVQTGSIIGTVTDVNGETPALAKVLLAGPKANDRHAAITNDNGFLEFHDVRPGVSYYVIVSGGGFGDWRSATGTITPNQSKILTGIRLRVATVYGPNFVPLTVKLKFRLAFRTAIDRVTFAGIAAVAGAQQAGHTPDYGQGAQGYTKRFGAGLPMDLPTS